MCKVLLPNKSWLLAILFAFTCQSGICFSAEKVEGKININTASEEQIALVPGIGPKIAKEVVGYRTVNGNFKNIEDVKRVSGVGDKKFEKIKDYLTLEGDSTIKSPTTEKKEKVKSKE
jgi:competence protein ComEA